MLLPGGTKSAYRWPVLPGDFFSGAIPPHDFADQTIAPAASHPSAYSGCAPQRIVAECIKPNQEKAAARRHQTAARQNRRSIDSVSAAATTSTKNKNPLPSPWTENQ